jgi:iron complex transport system ATP-binding protein
MLELEEIALVTSGFSIRIDRWHTEAGLLHALLGRNGAGKSTLLKVVAGELPHWGCARLHGIELSQWDARLRARHLAVLPQHSQLSFGFTADEVVTLGATPLSLGWRRLRIEVQLAMSAARCEELTGKPYTRMSGGEKQRVHLARCLLQLSQAEQAPLLLLDEPTSAQDLGQQHTMLQRVRQLCTDRGYGVLAVLHDLNHALRYAHRATLLDAGRVVATASPAELLTPQRVEAHWGYSAEYVTSERRGVALL